MIYPDKELQWQFNGIYERIRKIKNEIKVKKALIYILSFFEFTAFLLASKGLSFYIEDVNIVVFVILVFGGVMFTNTIYSIEYLSNNIKELEKSQVDIQKELEDLKDFSDYLTSYRHLESLKNGNNLYPELREADAKYVVEQYKDIYEEKRIEYEKQHQKRLKLNNHN